LLAEAYGKTDQPAEGIDATTKALELIATIGEERWAPMVYRVRATLLARSTKSRPDAESCFASALQAARAQGAKSFELQAAMGLARLWTEQGKINQARDLLAPVYGWFTEGFDTSDLTEARSLLDALR
jgi:predicted ATPase